MNNTGEVDSSSAAVEAPAHAVPADTAAPPVPAPASTTTTGNTIGNDISAVSGAALGSLLGYVKEFGTPHQSARAGTILDCLSSLGKHPTLLHNTRSTTGSNTTDEDPKDVNALEKLRKIGDTSNDGDIDCPAIRQHLYEIAGDWLWAHACNDFRHKIAKDAAIPPDLREEALRLSKPISMDDEKILNDENAKERGYFSFSGYAFPGSETYYDEEDEVSDV